MGNDRSTGLVLRCGILFALCAVATAAAQTPTYPGAAAGAPTLALPPGSPQPPLNPALTQSVPPGQQAPNAQMQPPPITPMSQHVDTPDAPSPQINAAMNNTVRPERNEARGLTPNFLGFLGPFKAPIVPPLFDGNETRLQSLIRDGKLYLTLQDAIALALENNLDVETEQIGRAHV